MSTPGGGVFSTVGRYHEYTVGIPIMSVGGYHEYTGGCAVHQGFHTNQSFSQ